MTGPGREIEIEEQEMEEAPAPPGKRIAGIAITVVVLAALVFGYLHVSLPSVPAGQAAPSGHAPGPCWVCHTLSASEGTANGE